MGHPLVFSVRYQPNIADNVLREAPFFGRDPTGCPAHAETLLDARHITDVVTRLGVEITSKIWESSG